MCVSVSLFLFLCIRHRNTPWKVISGLTFVSALMVRMHPIGTWHSPSLQKDPSKQPNWFILKCFDIIEKQTENWAPAKLPSKCFHVAFPREERKERKWEGGKEKQPSSRTSKLLTSSMNCGEWRGRSLSFLGIGTQITEAACLWGTQQDILGPARPSQEEGCL